MTTADSQAAAPHKTGAATMSPAMADLRAYPRYLFEQVRPALGRRVWEIGVGYGTYTALLLESGCAVLATDVDDQSLASVRDRFRDDPQLTTAWIDLEDESAVRSHQSFGADSILCLNVLEHIEYDARALLWLRESIQPRGRLGLIVPALPALFGRMDAEAGHFRRYTRRSLHAVLEAGGWRIERLRYINLVAAAGWWFHNRVRRNAGLADPAANRQMRSADRWLPWINRCTDPLFGWCAGGSLVAIARTGD